MNKEINWEKRYRELFVPKCGDDEVCNAFWQSNIDFISDLLEKIEKVEKWKLINMPNLQKMEAFNHEVIVYNQALEDIKKLLT